MPGVDEAALRAAIDAGVRAALAALEEPAEDYPDWDEFGNAPVPLPAERTDTPNSAAVITPVTEPQDVVPEGPSLLRQAARGQVDMTVDYTADGEEILPEPGGMRGDVVPITAVEPIRGMGFDPRGNGEWFARERAKDLAQRRAPAWESVVKQVG